MSWWSRIANAFRGDRLSREIDEELESHIAEAVEQGRDPSEARKAFGGALRTREECRDFRALAWMESLRAGHDIRMASVFQTQGDDVRGGAIAGAGNRGLHVGFPAD
ncbi:MAG: hypothetical protein WDO73_32180 [Ignavibacteriota bacterium]